MSRKACIYEFQSRDLLRKMCARAVWSADLDQITGIPPAATRCHVHSIPDYFSSRHNKHERKSTFGSASPLFRRGKIPAAVGGVCYTVAGLQFG